VKAFGRLMVKDHHAMRVEGMALAKKDSITPAMPAGDADEAAEKAVADSLNSMPKGADWDKFYIDHMVTGHESVLRFAQDAANSAQNADLKALIQKATPTVQKHLDRAKEIQTKLAAAKP
jgi:putative membrane protein